MKLFYNGNYKSVMKEIEVDKTNENIILDHNRKKTGKWKIELYIPCNLNHNTSDAISELLKTMLEFIR